MFQTRPTTRSVAAPTHSVAPTAVAATQAAEEVAQ
jgi:hypothetical protein